MSRKIAIGALVVVITAVLGIVLANAQSGQEVQRPQDTHVVVTGAQTAPAKLTGHAVAKPKLHVNPKPHPKPQVQPTKPTGEITGVCPDGMKSSSHGCVSTLAPIRCTGALVGGKCETPRQQTTTTTATPAPPSTPPEEGDFCSTADGVGSIEHGRCAIAKERTINCIPAYMGLEDGCPGKP